MRYAWMPWARHWGGVIWGYPGAHESVLYLTTQPETPSGRELAGNVYCGNIHLMLDMNTISGFDWDEGNLGKNVKHDVDNREAEEVFFNQPLLITPDETHSTTEARFRALGHTDSARRLTVIFTLRMRGTLIRIISARVMHRKEKAFYEQES